MELGKVRLNATGNLLGSYSDIELRQTIFGVRVALWGARFGFAKAAALSRNACESADNITSVVAPSAGGSMSRSTS